MKIIIDANILMDLIKTDSIDNFFRLNYEMHTTKQVVVGECNDSQQSALLAYSKSNKLTVHSFNQDEEDLIEELVINNSRLSVADCSVLYLALILNSLLVTGDKKLRNVSREKSIMTKGIFWLFDEMLDQRVMSKKERKEKLLKLREVNRWLPAEEFKKRI